MSVQSSKDISKWKIFSLFGHSGLICGVNFVVKKDLNSYETDYISNFKLFIDLSDIFAKYWICIKEVRILDSAFSSYTFLKIILCKTLKIFSFTFHVIRFYHIYHNTIRLHSSWTLKPSNYKSQMLIFYKRSCVHPLLKLLEKFYEKMICQNIYFFRYKI